MIRSGIWTCFEGKIKGLLHNHTWYCQKRQTGVFLSQTSVQVRLRMLGHLALGSSRYLPVLQAQVLTELIFYDYEKTMNTSWLT